MTGSPVRLALLLLNLPALGLVEAVDLEELGSACKTSQISIKPRPQLRPRSQLQSRQRLTRIALPVKVVVGVAVALERRAHLLARRAVGEGHVVVGDVVEEVDLLLVQHQGRRDRVHGRVAPPLVEEAAVAVQALKVVDVSLGAEPVEIADLEIGPLKGVSREGESEAGWGD